MNVRKQLNFLDTTKNVKPFDHNGHKYYLIRCAPQKYHEYYLIDCLDKIGEGGIGQVYKAYPVSKNGNVDFKQQFVAKKIKPNNNRPLNIDLIKREAKLNGYLYQTENPVIQHLNDKPFQAFIISQLLPGKTLNNLIKNPEEQKPNLNKLSKGLPNKDNEIIEIEDLTNETKLENLNFSQRIHLITTIALAFSNIHHDSPASGPAIFTGDLKFQNILFQFIKKNTNPIFNIYPIDFGLAMTSNDLLKGQGALGGTPLYIPPEAFYLKSGLKSDIWSLVPIIITFLGGKDPFANRKKLEKQGYFNFSAQYFATQYNLDGLFEKIDLSFYPENLKEQITSFIMRMQDLDYNQRPDMDEVLTFFLAVHNTCKIVEDLKAKNSSNPKEEINDIALIKHIADETKSYLAKIKLIENKLWHKKVGAGTFENYDFVNDPLNLAETILTENIKQNQNKNYNLIIQTTKIARSYLAESKSTTFRDKRLSFLKRNLTEAFVQELFKLKDSEFIFKDSKHLIEIIKQYKNNLNTLNVVLEELSDQLNTADLSTSLNDKVLKKLFSNLVRGETSNEPTGIENEILLKIKDHEESKHRYVGKKYHLFFSSRLNKIIDKIDLVLNDKQYKEEIKLFSDPKKRA